MQYIKKCWIIHLISLILLFLITLNAIAVQAMPVLDSIDDVWSQQTQTKDDFIDGIDIVLVSPQGSMITLECGGTITVPSELSANNMDVSLSYFLLFSDDNNPADWEAAIMLSSRNPGYREAYWITANEMENPIAFWEISPACIPWWGECNGWSEASEGSHYLVSGNQITFYFNEFAGIDGAELLCITMAVVGTDVYYDWAPDFYERQTFFKVSTTGTKTSISSETSTPEEPTSSLTTNEQETSTEMRTTPLDNTTPPAIPGFESIPVLMALPILLWLRRREYL